MPDTQEYMQSARSVFENMHKCIASVHVYAEYARKYVREHARTLLEKMQ
jgi:hypothetical protein